MTCSSDDGGCRYCRADTQNYVQLTRQISGSRCQQGYSWGYDPRGIWVDRGCRAQFVYGRGRSDSGSNTSAAIAGGILGALILGAAVAASKSDNDDGGDHERVNYYNDGYRMGRQDADEGRRDYYQWWSERYSTKYERDFAAGYADGYHNYGRRPPR
ncbi:DUF3011 domain-containing protein [Tunturiibacter gelidoferens]|uniref:DUF3011 domain-containing protein n=1 Tax=Tunturiibacter gelidiferens TaxID=3069689 RepID=A0A9X0QJI9_9BACT|nr:DUF3011 domain-containing protein [Edaphobacter lichenicola]MBB5331475.1 hypothetical protein [Edaphobacter lichenicola]